MKIMKQSFSLLFTAGIVSLLSSCNSGNKETTKQESVQTTDTSTASIKTSPETAFMPFDAVVITQTVKDYSKWRPFFNSDSTYRKASGLEDIVVGRGIDNPKNIMVALKVSDLQKAKDFSTSPRLKEIMGKAGVISKPDIQFFHVIRANTESKEKQWVMVTHKVKNFDAWLKVFDEEGTANRASQGLIDVVLARGINDSNVVHLVFDIKDMAKAKASIFSDAKKKLMKSAGVIGEPKIEFYTTAE